MLKYSEMAAEVMDHFIDHDSHGYSQPNRDGDGTTETITLSDGTEVSFAGGDRDCSRLVQTCYVVVGVLPRGMHMWTGNEREILAENGFVEVPLSEAERGDILWREGHTEMYLGDDMQGGARLDEYGGITGPDQGDQTGDEITRSTYRPYTWESCWRCMYERVEPPKPAQYPGEPANDAGLYYRAHVATLGWLDTVRDGQEAGTTGYGLALEGLRIQPPEGVVLAVEAHIAGIGWRHYEGIQAGERETSCDPLIGTIGEARAIEGLRIECRSRHRLRYRVHVVDYGWTPWVLDGEATGSVGEGRAIQAVQLILEG